MEWGAIYGSEGEAIYPTLHQAPSAGLLDGRVALQALDGSLVGEKPPEQIAEIICQLRYLA